MRYLQVMPPEETFLGFDVGLLLALSIALIAAIVLFDRSRAIVSWMTRKNR